MNGPLLATDLRIIFGRLERDGRAAEAVVIRDAMHLLEWLSPAIMKVVDERRRQVTEEGWTAEHDDQHAYGAMAIAGACYALHAASAFRPAGWFDKVSDTIVGIWPWARVWWKPKDPARDLERSCALLIAELERIDRAEAKAGQAVRP